MIRWLIFSNASSSRRSIASRATWPSRSRCSSGDVQPVLNGYLAGRYPEKHFLAASRPWPRYDEDYRPLVEYAKAHGLPVLAANAPRRLVNLVTREGPEALEKLPEEELRWLPPLPYVIPESGRYVEKLREVFSNFPDHGKKEKDALPGPRRKRDWLARGAPGLEDYNDALKKSSGKKGTGKMSGGMPHTMMKMMSGKKKGFPSQSLWDASMAHAVAEYLKAHPGVTVVPVNGSFHSDEHLGTVEQLLRYRPGTRVAVISINPHEAFPALNVDALGGLGDVIIVTDPSWR